MKSRLVALKLYLAGLAIGLFILGWALIARSEAADLASQASPRRVTSAAPTLSGRPDALRQPRIRTRSS